MKSLQNEENFVPENNVQSSTVEISTDHSEEQNVTGRNKKRGKRVLLIFCAVGVFVAGLSGGFVLNNLTVKNLSLDKNIIGEEVNNLFDENGLVMVSSGGRYGYLDKTGNYAINPQFDGAESFNDGIAVVHSNYQYGYINIDGEYIVNAQFQDADDFTDGLARVCSGGKYGYINKKGEYVINPQFDSARDFYDGLARVSIGNKYGFINTRGEYVIQPLYDDAYSFCNGLAAVKSGSNWGFIDKNGDMIINFQYNKVTDMYDDGYALALCNDDKTIIIDKTGNMISNMRFDGVFG